MWQRRKTLLKSDKINLFVTKSCESLAVLEASYEITFLLAEKLKPFSDGKEIIKPCPQKFAQSIGYKSIEKSKENCFVKANNYKTH